MVGLLVGRVVIDPVGEGSIRKAEAPVDYVAGKGAVVSGRADIINAQFMMALRKPSPNLAAASFSGFWQLRLFHGIHFWSI
jgi:hypothetical protein